MIDTALLTTLAFAFTAGVATFFSPCAYPLLPGYVGFYVSQVDGERASLEGALVRGAAAGVGVLVTFSVLVSVAFRVGHATLSRITLFEPIVGGALVVLGVLVVFDRAPTFSIPLPKRRSSAVGFAVFGAGYALAAAGCVAPIFLSVVTRALTLPSAEAAIVLSTYAGGVALLMVALTIATGTGLLASAGRLSAYSRSLERLAGGVMILAGLGQLYLAIVVLEVV